MSQAVTGPMVRDKVIELPLTIEPSLGLLLETCLLALPSSLLERAH